jgi:hypothetical protein
MDDSIAVISCVWIVKFKQNKKERITCYYYYFFNELNFTHYPYHLVHFFPLTYTPTTLLVRFSSILSYFVLLGNPHYVPRPNRHWSQTKKAPSFPHYDSNIGATLEPSAVPSEDPTLAVFFFSLVDIHDETIIRQRCEPMELRYSLTFTLMSKVIVYSISCDCLLLLFKLK